MARLVVSGPGGAAISRNFSFSLLSVVYTIITKRPRKTYNVCENYNCQGWILSRSASKQNVVAMHGGSQNRLRELARVERIYNNVKAKQPGQWPGCKGSD